MRHVGTSLQLPNAQARDAAVILLARDPASQARHRRWGAAGVPLCQAFRARAMHVVTQAGADAIFSYAGQAPDHRKSGWRYWRQRGRSFGDRLCDAAARAFAAGFDRVVLVGYDVPDLRPDHIEQALHLLNEAPLVVGRDDKGGCYLIGLRRESLDVLRGVTWQQNADAEMLLRLPGARAMAETLVDADGIADLILISGSTSAPLDRLIRRVLVESRGHKQSSAAGFRPLIPQNAALDLRRLQTPPPLAA